MSFDPQPFRQQYRAAIRPGYNPWLHAGFVLAYGGAWIVFFLSRLEQPSLLEWLTVPAALVFFNWGEYRIHKSLGHHKHPLGRMFYKRHTGDHHSFFVAGQLRLSAPLAFTPRYLAPLLARFAERHPQLRVDVQADDRFVNLQEPRFDMALRMGRLDDSCLVARPITANRHLLCASPDYLARHGVPQHPEELQAHDGLVYYNREPGGMLCLPVDGEPASFRIRVRMRTDSGHQLLEGARAGLGLAILPSFLAADALLAGELLPVLPGYSPDGGQVSVVYRKTQRTPRKILVLGQFLEEEIGDPAPWDRALIERGLLPPG